MQEHPEIVDACLSAFIEAGTLDLSLDQVARRIAVSKRMLIHYFGTRETLEERVMTRLEESLRARFAAGSSAPGATLRSVVLALWDQTTMPAARGILLLIMDVTRRGWSGSERARAFYEEQGRLWREMLVGFLPGEAAEEFLQLFQGALLVFLVTGDRAQGRRSLERFVERSTARPAKGKKKHRRN